MNPRLLLIAALGLLFARGAAVAADRPNILWITSEDNSPYLGCYGDSQAHTPNLDRLASQGVRYRNAFANSAVCSSARSTLITGMHALPRGKRNIHDSGTRVPLIIRFLQKWAHLAPARPGEWVDQLVSFVDFPVTVFSLCGAPIPGHYEGRAFLGEKKSAPREHVFLYRDRMDERYDTVRAIRDREIRYVRNYAPHRPWGQHYSYPFQQIVDAAEIASRLDPAAVPRLTTLLGDGDSAVRYWAALGFLMRGKDAVMSGQAALRTALNDTSPHARIAAAHALAQYGPDSALAPSLAVLRELAPPEKNGVFVAMSALNVIEALGAKAAPGTKAKRGKKGAAN
ncbi:MAG: sulfatase-like hydrolase/transferase [Verrucomicrobia bacterium]|nr:sulfatase-like hydrolase/transferase [Verrucomicrobiota bacterium]